MNSSASATASATSEYITDGITPCNSFDEMDLSDGLLRGVYAFGFDKPSKPQSLAIIPMIKGGDMLCQSQSGTGKTGVIVIGSLACIDPTIQAPQILVLCHTRELAQQTEKVFRGLGAHLKISEHQTGIKVLSATGGTPVSNDLKALRGGAQVVIGTPGRIYDLLKREGGMKTQHLKWLILDEADQLLEDLFAEQIHAILATGAFPPTCRLGMFSATMPRDVLDLADTYLKSPTRILLPAEEVRLEGIQQFYVDAEREEWKYDVLCDLSKYMTINQAIVFVNKKPTAEKLSKRMADDGYTLEFIHGEMETAERKKRMEDFRSGAVRVLIATDVLARGIDVQTVNVVINYEMPTNRENYLHRIGRTGRYGRKGLSINLIAGADELAMQKDIEKTYSLTVATLPQDISTLGK